MTSFFTGHEKLLPYRPIILKTDSGFPVAPSWALPRKINAEFKIQDNSCQERKTAGMLTATRLLHGTFGRFAQLRMNEPLVLRA